eukprot:12723968-Alexandrium_andersonii.AAC.1
MLTPRQPVRPMFLAMPTWTTWPPGRVSMALRAVARILPMWSPRWASAGKYCSVQCSRCRRTS